MRKQSTPSLAAFIGRFSTAHRGHLSVVKRGLERYDFLHIVIGSHEQPRTIKNPWTAPERESMLSTAIYEEFGKEAAGRITYSHAHDFPYNDTSWLNEVNGFIEARAADLGTEDITLLGSDRDDSTFYLAFFPHLAKDLIPQNEALGISATAVRNAYFGGSALLKDMLPQSTINFLAQFKLSPAYTRLKEEFDYIEMYKKQWSVAPYPPTFVTVDAVVTQAGHVLLIRRGDSPGKGLWALPGGFLEQHELTLDGAIRELREETRLKVPVPVLKGSMVKRDVFDKPDRSLRGRTVTIAYHFKLAELGTLPEVKASSDARKAQWVLLSDVLAMRDQFFEDHFHIIEAMTA